MNHHTHFLRRTFVGAAVFLLLAGIVFRLFTDASPLFEFLGLTACVAPAALVLSTGKRWLSSLSECVADQPGVWLACSVSLGIIAVYLSFLAEQYSSSLDIIPFWGVAILSLSAVPAMLFIRKYLSAFEWIFMLQATLILCLTVNKFHATGSAVVVAIVYLSVLMLAVFRRFFYTLSPLSFVSLVPLLYSVFLVFAYSPLTWELHKWWNALTTAAFDDESAESWWAIVAREAISRTAFFGGVPDTLAMREPLFSNALIAEAVQVQSDNGYQLLHMISRWGWFGVLPILIALGIFLVCGYLLVLRRKGMHAYVSLAAMTAMAASMLLSLSQNLGYTVVLVDSMPFLDFDPIGNALWLLMVCLVASEHSVHASCCELFPKEERKAHRQRYQTEILRSLAVTHYRSTEELLQSHAVFQLLQKSTRKHLCADDACTQIELYGNFNGIRKALQSMSLSAEPCTSALVILERWSSSVPKQDSEELYQLVLHALPGCDGLWVTKITNLSHPTGFWRVRIILTQDSQNSDLADTVTHQEQEEETA